MMFKKLVVTLLLCSVATLLLVACGGTTSNPTPAPGNTPTSIPTSTTSTGGSSNEVHMGNQTFVQTSTTISKGSSITLINDAAVPHIIMNGSWENGTAKPAQEPGAPTVNAQFKGNDRQTIGPFNTAGTYHLYCTIHQNMNLTVIVQ